ncbi:putative two-component system response regulator [[Actinomadura] parvosata subsp. kistnae]|uniref:DNA-binding response regulator n=1 Tax=[Actinomadura] parvosata subsp. kistnae TaxID=1909395 RepID=A0A1V0A1T4_9ACTN|nr:response regulator transcription factor [Nonomuraea sp. ATCC 55076]AQZ64158.1 DNA-binding response regulator [Nonomuraea sp. ATCC 55076]SPL87357.1 putative two-component system response regulator [Actinomadura parvosata subsp. kistnae]
MIKVLIADDQDLVRGGLAALLGLEDDIEVVAEVGRGDEVPAATAEHDPDVVLLDIEMPGLSGLEVAERLRDRRVIIVTTFGRAGYLNRALEAGVAGFVVKDAPAAELAAAVRRVMAGEQVIDPKLAVSALTTGPSPLTQREAEVLRMASGEPTVAAIARRLFLTEGTVRNYLSSAIGKTGARNRAEAVRVAEERGWL